MLGGIGPRPWTTRTPRRPQPRPRPGESTSRPSTLYPALPCGGGSAVPQTPLRPGRKDTWEPGAGGAWAEEEASARQGRGETAGSQGRGRSRNDPRAALPREPRDPPTHPKEAGGPPGEPGSCATGVRSLSLTLSQESARAAFYRPGPAGPQIEAGVCAARATRVHPRTQFQQEKQEGVCMYGTPS